MKIWERCWWCGERALGQPWRRDPSVKFCDTCGERNIDPIVLDAEVKADRKKNNLAMSISCRFPVDHYLIQG